MISVLFVDDETALLDISTRYLERTGGFRVDTAESAHAAFEKIRTTTYDAIVSDYQMPEMDGIQFLKALRTSGDSTPFIIFTGKGREDVVIQAFENGADFYIQKGGEPKSQFAELAHKIRTAVQLNHDKKALLESEEILRFIVRHDPNAIAVYDTSLNYIAVSDRYLKDYGVKEEDIIGKHHYAVFPEMPQKWKDVHQRCMAGAIEHNEDDFFERPDGSITYNRWECRPWFKADRTIGGIVTYTEVTTERKLAEEALAFAQQKYAKAFLAAPDAITISELDSGQLIEVNDAASVIFGYSREEMIGRNASELGIWRNRADRKALVDQVLAYGHVSRYEVIEQRKSGEQFLASVNADTMTIGGTRYIIAIIRDISDKKQMEEVRRETEERYHNIIEDQTEFICRFLPDGTHVFVNGAYARYFGKGREELIGHIFRANTYPDDREKVRQFFATLTPDHPVDFIEHRIVMPNGEVRWQRWSDRAIFDESEKIVEYQSVGRDITQQKQTEQALRESESRYRNVVEDQTEFVCRFLPNGTHVFVNEAYCRNFNMSRNDIIGHVFIPDIPEEDREIVRQHFRSLTPENPVAIVAHRIILPGGSIHWQRWSDRAIFDKFGKIVEYQSVGRDITPQKQIETALRDSEQLRLEIINHLPDPTFAINEKGEVIAWNKAIEEFLGIKAEDMIGKGNYEYALPFYGERRPILIDLAILPDEYYLLEKYDGISRLGETLVAETTIARPQGRTAILWAKASPLYNKSGRFIGAIETIRDITERKHEETKLRNVNMQLNLLSSITRHDILNQLMVLKGYLELTRNVIGDPKTLSEFLRKGEDAALAIEELILFTSEYQDLGVKKPEWQNVNTSIAYAKANLPLGGIAVETESSTLEVYADPLFERVFYNLIDNAIRYGGDQMTRIRFSSQASDTGLILICEDDGEGVPARQKTAIFNREFYKHTGFGLYLSREILAITGITIIENGEPGKGARFEITVPKAMYRFNALTSVAD